ncbi:acyl-CoA dehydrogenase family protein [Pseudonocardia nematodicida]|uniref:Acyl-CoA dehydrogenase family protein n=1 Tax=Pseudonocardia nematodicida TaxID=1206997 RepID=A0ABV1KIN6_9PSEU
MTATASPPVTLPVPDLSGEALAALTAEVAATAEQHDRSGEIPTAGIAAAHRAGVLTATVAARHGGPDVSPVDALRILVALGEGDPSVALLAANTLQAHRGQAAVAHWPEATYAEVLRRSAARPTLINAVRAEPELGAPARGGLPATVARRTPEGWSLTGHKAYATGGAALAHHVVWVVADEPGGDPSSPRVGHLLVPGDASGITWLDTWDHLGLRASNTHDVVYDDVTVPADAFVEIPRGPGGVYTDPAAAAGPASFGHPALYVGVARAARAAFVRYARERVPAALGRPIAETDRIRTVAGEIDALITQAETLLYGAVLRTDLDPRHYSLLKVRIADSVVEAVQTAVAALGNPALTRHQPFERHLRDVLCVRVHPPQADAALLGAGRHLLSTTTSPRETDTR